MSDLISRQDAIDAVMELIEAGYEWRSGVSRKISLLNAVYCALEDIPSAQPTAETVRHGKWIYGEHDIAMCDGYRCSNCGYFVPWDYSHKSIDYIEEYKYCPNCGARMDEE